MANLGDTNFSVQPQVNLASIASLYQKKVTDEQQMKLQQSEIATQQQDRVMNVMKMATDLTQHIIQTSAQNQMRTGQKNLQALLANQDQPVPSDQMTPAASSMIPQLSQAPVSVPQSQTPEFQDQLRATLMQANPQATTEALAKQQFPLGKVSTDQLLANAIKNGDQPTIDQITTAKKNEKQPKGAGILSVNRLMPDGSTHKIVRDGLGNETDMGAIGSSTTNIPPAQARNTAVVAQQVFPHIQVVRDLINQADAMGMIGPGSARVYSKFLAGKVGSTGYPEKDALLGKLRVESNLLASAALKVHFGARGGQQMYEHFSKNLDTTTQSKDMLMGEIDGFEDYIKGYANPNPASVSSQPGMSLEDKKAALRKKLGL